MKLAAGAGRASTKTVSFILPVFVGALLAMGATNCTKEDAAKPAETASAPAARSPGAPSTQASSKWTPECRVNQGCPAPESLPVCAGGEPAGALTAAQVLADPSRHVGKIITVIGALGASSECTETDCDPSHVCCNSCSGNATIGQDGRQGIEIMDPARADRFRCSGDQSLQCCATEIKNQKVQATGTLRSPRQLAIQSLCVPARA
jgi:hypothetical protein